MAFAFGCIVTLCLIAAQASLGQLQSRSGMDVPMGTPELDDKFSQGLASYIGVESLPGANRGLFGAPVRGSGALGRSGASGGSTNDINNMYNSFGLPTETGNNQGGMRKWYGPEFAPPMPPNAPSMNGPMRGGNFNNYFQPPQNFQGEQRNIAPPPPNDGGIQVTDLSCPELRSVIGLSNDRNQWLSTVECECRLNADKVRQHFCYSLCDPPKAEQRCTPSYSILNSCPAYRDCEKWNRLNDTDGGAVACKTGEPVPESVCWILASSMLRDDETPIRPAFYANAAGGCYMTCLCGNDGTVAGQFQCLKTPTSQWTFPIYPRAVKYNFTQNV